MVSPTATLPQPSLRSSLLRRQVKRMAAYLPGQCSPPMHSSSTLCLETSSFHRRSSRSPACSRLRACAQARVAVCRCSNQVHRHESKACSEQHIVRLRCVAALTGAPAAAQPRKQLRTCAQARVAVCCCGSQAYCLHKAAKACSEQHVVRASKPSNAVATPCLLSAPARLVPALCEASSACLHAAGV